MTQAVANLRFLHLAEAAWPDQNIRKTQGDYMANKEHLAVLRQGVEAWNRWRGRNPAIFPDLSVTDLVRANLCGANFSEADLSVADLSGANLMGADLSGANLGVADLSGTNLTGADLRGANVKLATVGYTVFGAVDLSEVKGLETVNHYRPSTIGIDTIYKSKGKIPPAFLRGCGMPDNLIAYVGSLAGKPIEYYSCFIGYSNSNQECARRIHADLQNQGVRCWFAPEDLKWGTEIQIGIDAAIRKQDRLLLVLSQQSVASDWVKQEVETALAREREEKRLVLFPIRLDGAVLQSGEAWAADLRRTRYIGDFSNWQDHNAYQTAFARLLQDLKVQDAAV